MRITLEFGSERRLSLPMQYNYTVQGFLYGNITPELGEFLHDHGFMFEKRSFKMFTFSRLQERYELKGDIIVFFPPVTLTISSPFDRFIQELANTMLQKGDLELAGCKVYVANIKVLPEVQIGDEIRINMLSPVVVYSTLETKEGKKKTYYYSPFEDEFTDSLDNNLRKKYEAFFAKKPRARKLVLEAVGRPKEKIMKYRGTIIKGWMGRFVLNGNKTLLKLGYDCGIGAKNSQGFGMVEMINVGRDR
jgi:CRISPR-associated endoribonuclease Cas6